MKQAVLSLMFLLGLPAVMSGQRTDTLKADHVYGGGAGMYEASVRADAAPADTIDFGKVYEDDVWTIPFYPGGEHAMHKFVYENLHMPKDAWADTTYYRGIVIVEVVITKGGKACFIRPVSRIHPSLCREVERVVNKMPLWRPATRMNENVNCRLRLVLHAYNTSMGRPYEAWRTTRQLNKMLRRKKTVGAADLDTIIGKVKEVRDYTKHDYVLNVTMARALLMRGDTAEALSIMEQSSRAGFVGVRALYKRLQEKKKKKYRLTDTGDIVEDALNMFRKAEQDEPYHVESYRKAADELLYSRVMAALMYAGACDSTGFASSCDSLVNAYLYVSSKGMIHGGDVGNDPYYRRERERVLGDMLGGEARNAVRRRVSVSKNVDVGSTVGNIDDAIRQGVVDDASTVQSNRRYHSLKDEFAQRYSVRASRRYRRLVEHVLKLRSRPLDKVAEELRPVLWLACPASDGGSPKAVKKSLSDFKRQRRHSYLYKRLKSIEENLGYSVMLNLLIGE